MMTNKQETADRYQQMLTAFVQTGERPDMELVYADPIARYLAETMNDDAVRAEVLNDEIAARVFVDTMIQFVSLNLAKANFRFQRTTAERQLLGIAASWSYEKRRDNWQALLQQVADDYEAYGFERGFYVKQANVSCPTSQQEDAVFENFLNDWKRHYDLREAAERERFLKERQLLQDRLLETNLKAVPKYMRENDVTNTEFMQTWALMGGRWNELEFRRLHRVARLQRKYPVLEQLARRIGRVADPLGAKRIGTTSGRADLAQHAAPSDILGVTTGRDLGALLPSEWAQWFDERLSDVFLKKYVTGRLQTFDYQSRLAKSARSLHTTPARPKGPVVLCVDMSGSMEGTPHDVAMSMTMRLAEICQTSRRECFLIAFSDRAKPLEVLHDRTSLLHFFKQRAEGDTDARAMLTMIDELLSERGKYLDAAPRYVGADVLWITDFRIPLPPPPFLQTMERLQEGGTKFYGLQVGEAVENRWTGRMNEIVRV